MSRAACSAHRRTWSRSPGARNDREASPDSAERPTHTVPTGLPSWGSGPATPVRATATSDRNTRRAPRAISRAHSSLTRPGPRMVSSDTPRRSRLASAEYTTAEPRK
jgi:hypothetical protein